MQVTTIFGQSFTTLQSLKDFALLHNIIPSGNKSHKATWINAVVAHYMTAQTEVVALVVEADPIAATIAIKVEDTAVSIGRPVVAVLTSEAAVLAYRVILKAIAFAMVMVWLLTAAAVKWGWDHRSDTAVYHWIKDAIGSEFAMAAITYVILGERVIIEWIDSIRSAVTSTVQDARVWVGGMVADARSVVG